MFTIITKQEYWNWLDSGIARPLQPRLGFIGKALRRLGLPVSVEQGFDMKDVQDTYILSRLPGAQGTRILEVGGGNSRVLRHLAKTNECWLVDKFEGFGGGPRRAPKLPGVKIVQDYIGSFNPALPDACFDTLLSISVVEHVPLERLEDFFRDCARLLKPGGRMIHAIDTYVYDPADRQNPGARAFIERTAAYLRYADRPDLGIALSEPPAVAPDFTFSCCYASTPDHVLWRWNQARPDKKRSLAQVVSIKAEWVKRG
jgi:SAM-dependent methyltransferase